MIKLTYTIFCDLCKKECHQEIYDCSNQLGGAFPRPSNQYTYQMNGCCEMCNECAAPILEAKHEVIRQYVLKRDAL